MATIKAIEQKAQRYDEALEKLRSLHDDYDTVSTLIDIKEELENIFPELKESEDEKIKQLLLRFVKYDMSDNYSDDFTPADCVAWLEKQGKNNMGISEATKQKLKDNLNKALEKETPESWDKFLDWQGVQKPWSEEDEDILNTIINHFKVDIECTDDDDIIKWLKSLKDRVQPQQEWSEEDKETINNLIDYLENELDSSYTDLDKKSFAKEIKLLKSLSPQPHWKPSKGQMEALWNVYRGGKEQAKLATLYNDLKKLMDK